MASVLCSTFTHTHAHRNSIRVLLALGSPMDCRLLATALKSSRQRLEAVASAVSTTEIIQQLSQGNVDVALVNADLQDGPLAGLQALAEIHAAYQNTPIIALFDTWNDDWIVHAFRAGAMGVFCRSEKKLEMLWKCISAVHEGQVWANSVQMQLLLKALRRANPVRSIPSTGTNLLTARETQVATLVAEGVATRDITKRLTITEHTVNNYLFRIYNKLGISNRLELALYIKQAYCAPVKMDPSGKENQSLLEYEEDAANG